MWNGCQRKWNLKLAFNCDGICIQILRRSKPTRTTQSRKNQKVKIMLPFAPNQSICVGIWGSILCFIKIEHKNCDQYMKCILNSAMLLEASNKSRLKCVLFKFMGFPFNYTLARKSGVCIVKCVLPFDVPHSNYALLNGFHHWLR